mmetsp:Transcript_37538/g.45849  ORF Transcript_37538/g.45849 Transcript_37538/m.45849 type:complete len:106 (-) Transcript_37538:622-939(-)
MNSSSGMGSLATLSLAKEWELMSMDVLRSVVPDWDLISLALRERGFDRVVEGVDILMVGVDVLMEEIAVSADELEVARRCDFAIPVIAAAEYARVRVVNGVTGRL